MLPPYPRMYPSSLVSVLGRKNFITMVSPVVLMRTFMFWRLTEEAASDLCIFFYIFFCFFLFSAEVQKTVIFSTYTFSDFSAVHYFKSNKVASTVKAEICLVEVQLRYKTIVVISKQAHVCLLSKLIRTLLFSANYKHHKLQLVAVIKDFEVL